MALDQSALLELLEMMRSADDGELMRRLLGTIMQALVDAEATAHIRRDTGRHGRRHCFRGRELGPELFRRSSCSRSRRTSAPELRVRVSGSWLVTGVSTDLRGLPTLPRGRGTRVRPSVGAGVPADRTTCSCARSRADGVRLDGVVR